MLFFVKQRFPGQNVDALSRDEMLRIFFNFVVPMHKRGVGGSNSSEQQGMAPIAAKATTSTIKQNSNPLSMDTDETIELNPIKRKKNHPRIEPPSIESVTNGCKRIKLFNNVELDQQHRTEVSKRSNNTCMVNIVAINQNA